MIHRYALTFLIILLAKSATAAEPAWWTQQKRKCGLPAGLAYNTWQSQGSPCGGGSSGASSSGGTSIGADIGQAIGQGLVDAFKASDEAARARQAEEKRLKAEREQQQEAEAEARKQRLQSEMLEVSATPELSLDTSSSGELALMQDEDDTDTKSGSPQADEGAKLKGIEDATRCLSASAGNHCANVESHMHQVCIDNYNAGYKKGSKERENLLKQAHQAGARDKSNGKKNSSFTHKSAQGPCRLEWIDSYNAGYTNR